MDVLIVNLAVVGAILGTMVVVGHPDRGRRRMAAGLVVVGLTLIGFGLTRALR